MLQVITLDEYVGIGLGVIVGVLDTSVFVRVGVGVFVRVTVGVLVRVAVLDGGKGVAVMTMITGGAGEFTFTGALVVGSGVVVMTTTKGVGTCAVGVSASVDVGVGVWLAVAVCTKEPDVRPPATETVWVAVAAPPRSALRTKPCPQVTASPTKSVNSPAPIVPTTAINLRDACAGGCWDCAGGAGDGSVA